MDGFGIPGSYVCSFQINGVAITDMDGFESFKCVEESGGGLPTFELIFRSADTGLLSYLNEGNILIAGYGVDQLDVSGIPLRIMSKDISLADSGDLRYIVNGYYDAISYMNNPNVMMSSNKSGIETIKDTVGKYFNTDFAPAQSNDKQCWAQHGQSDKEFVESVWTHCDLGNNDFPMIGITSDGTFRLRAMSDVTASNCNWNFTNTDLPTGNNIPFHQDWRIKSDTGFTNAAASYQKSADIVDLIKGPGSIFNTTIGSFLGQSSSLEQSSSVDSASQIAGSLLSNLNHHENYHQSHADNVSNLASSSSTKLYLNNSDMFFPIKVLDTIMFNISIQDGSSIQTISGLWIVTDVTRHIEENRFHTMITAVRESLNNISISS